MKRLRLTLLLFFLSLSVCMSAFPNNNKPDFAFPQTVDKTAQKDLKIAIENHDAHAALNALIRSTIAQTLIDPQNLSSSIKSIEDCQEIFIDSDISCLYSSLLAKLYYCFYVGQRWTFDRREMPLYPYPTDISEWSGEQFKNKIEELNQKSVECRSKLAAIPITTYNDIILIDKVSALYYPTLFDFVCSTAYSTTFYNKLGAKYCELGLEEAKANHSTGAIIQWSNILGTSVHNQGEYFKKQYQIYKDSELSGLLLFSLIGAMKNTSTVIDEEEIYGNASDSFHKQNEINRELVSLIDNFISSYPKAPFSTTLLSQKKVLLAKAGSLTAPNLCSPYEPFSLKLKIENAKDITVNVYEVTEELANKRNKLLADFLKKATPVKSISKTYSQQIPFTAEDTIKLTLDKPGYYAFIPIIDKEIANYDYPGLTRCIVAFPINLNNTSESILMVTDPATGQPMKNVEAIYSMNNKNYVLKPTDANGMTNSTSVAKEKRDWNNTLTLRINEGKYKNQKFAYKDFYPNIINGDSEYKEIKCEILTDRRLYHPGDTLKFLAVSFENSKTGGVASSKIIDRLSLEVKLINANDEQVCSLNLTTDNFGRAESSFALPTEGLTGDFWVNVYSGNKQIGSQSITVSDYKLPDFEVIITSTQRDVPQKGNVRIEGYAKYYSGFPLANAKISVILSKSSFWRWWQASEKFYSTEISTDNSGVFCITFDSSIFDVDDSSQKVYTAVFDAVSPSGTTATASTNFSLGKQYAINVSVPDIVNGEKPFLPSAEAINADGTKSELSMKWSIQKEGEETFSLNGIIDGKPIDISKLIPGAYTLVVEPTDSMLADKSEASFTVYNVKSGIVPPGNSIWTDKETLFIEPGHKVSLLLGTPDDTAYVYYTVSDERLRIINLEKISRGYANLNISLPSDFAEGNIRLFTVKDCKLNQINVEIKPIEHKELTIIGESFRDNLTPGANEMWKFKILDGNGKPIEAAVALEMYNKALDALTPQKWNFGFDCYHFMPTPSLNFLYLSNLTNSSRQRLKDLDFYNLIAPEFNFYGYNLSNGGIKNFNGYIRGRRMANAKMMNIAETEMEESDDAYLQDSAISLMTQSAGGSSSNDLATTQQDNGLGENERESKFQYRDSHVPIAIWEPMLTTDKDGDVCYSFTVPDANATWVFQSVAWTKQTEAGALIRNIVTNKPLMVQPNVPRFLRAGDSAEIAVSILNNSDSSCVASAIIELFNPLSGRVYDVQEFECEIDSMKSSTITAKVKAETSQSAIGFRVKAYNSRFSDGEQSIIQVLPSNASLIESKPFYLNPGDESISISLPSEKSAKITLTYCDNPVWSIVSALPGLRKDVSNYANSAAAAIFSAATAKGILKSNPKIAKVLDEWIKNPSDSTMISNLEKNDDLKIVALNATPWIVAAQSENERMEALSLLFNEKEINASFAKAFEILEKLQRGDGGWSWSDWCDSSSLWITENIMTMFADLKSYGWLISDKKFNDMLSKAVAYCDNNVDETDILYSIWRPRFKEIKNTIKGQKTISTTINSILKNWKKYSDPAYKALAAQALYLNGYTSKSKELLKSISQFSKFTDNQGLVFPSVNSLASYATLLDAYALITPQSKEVDGLRQQLIVRKQATDWGSTVVTTEVVSAILSSGTEWIEGNGCARVTVNGNNIISGNALENATGEFSAVVTDYAGEQLEIFTPSSGPSYGAVYTQFDKEMKDVKAASIDDLSIEKTLLVRKGTEWVYASDELNVGDIVRVQLTIHSKRNMQFVSIVDERPAAFEPVQQLPGWIFSEGLGFYRENKDSATTLHIISMNPGTYQLTYDMNVTISGTFSSGVATIQSQYAPELTAHSAGTIIKACR